VNQKLENVFRVVHNVPNYNTFGTVSGVKGLTIEAKGLTKFAKVSDLCSIELADKIIYAEVVGIKDDITILLTFSETAGLQSGSKIRLHENSQVIFPSDSLKGRVINFEGQPIDGKGPIKRGNLEYSLKCSPPPAHQRRRITEKLDTGIRAINAFLTTCKGQRQGVFAGSGVGKSILLSMITKFAKADVKVIGLIGERGREVNEFIEDNLGEDGLKDAVVIVSTSDESALARHKATLLTMTISEYFRDQGKDVITVLDSITRYAMALREIGIAAGELPTARGYTPSVFVELPKLLERSGPGTAERGTITGIFSVLVEGDDQSEPIADTVRSILDGHIVLDRKIANRGRYPAIDIMQSASRMIPKCNSEFENELVILAKRNISLYLENEDLIRIGAYKKGSDTELDKAINYYSQLEQFLSQKPNESENLEDCYRKLAKILEMHYA
jgi:flagellum-specific ATP synthase